MNDNTRKYAMSNLSREGRKRRAEMLPQLQQQMEVLQRKRRIRSRLAIAAVVLIAAAILWPSLAGNLSTMESMATRVNDA